MRLPRVRPTVRQPFLRELYGARPGRVAPEAGRAPADSTIGLIAPHRQSHSNRDIPNGSH
jgi:hypothetical protein